MKKLITIVLLLMSNLIFSQNLQRINDGDFLYKASNQAIVLWKIRVVDNNSEEFLNSNLFPLLRIIKYDKVVAKKWDTPINAAQYVYEKDEKGNWKKEGNKTIYEKIYLLEVNPKKEGYYFESLYLRNSADAKDQEIRRSPELPVFRKIAPENNKFYNYGTIEVTINHPNNNIFVKLINDNAEKTDLLNFAKETYPNVYNHYKDKISDDGLKFYFAARGDHSSPIGLKSFLHYWTSSDPKVVMCELHADVRFFSKTGQSPQAYITFKEIDLPVNFDIIYKSEWKNGEPDRPYGLILGNSANNKYYFYTTINGKSGIEGTTNGSNEAAEISNENVVSAGKLNKKNDYRIEVRNKKVGYYINNIAIGTFDLNADLSKACFIGFMVKDKQKVFFEEFQVIEP